MELNGNKNQVLCFAKYTLVPVYLNSGLHINSMCYSFIEFMVVMALYWHLISVNITLVNYGLLNRD